MTKNKKTVAAKPLIGVYPGTFDPVTLGHLDIIERAMKIVDHLVVAIADSPAKGPLFTIKKRVELMKTDVANNRKLKGKSIEVVAFDELLMDFVQSVNGRVIVRGLRAVSDFDYEFQMAGMNARLDQNIETIFLMASERQQFISSRFVKEIAQLGGDISSFVPKLTLERTLRRVGRTT
ncbi:MAG: pantetheine-phosphate adenylyltransferase [Acidiphilium sp. 21-62-4]|nr:MAG: pantetheine-phosphate adenylyltransferase [Acidiphilium sp. 21-62-4]